MLDKLSPRDFLANSLEKEVIHLNSMMNLTGQVLIPLCGFLFIYLIGAQGRNRHQAIISRMAI